ncbi:hypothetical protein BDV97DRAFT_225160 [Delphinella strobiligena]|nr:hypothetical protein BDV97DRAFT_225160 [Delphinella strobiligena]
MNSTGLESMGSPSGLRHSLLPAPSPDSAMKIAPLALSPALGRSYTLPKRKRATVTVVACQTCRKRKTKCDGARPVCRNCAKRYSDECVYDYDGHETRTTALKRKIIELQKDVLRLNKAQSSRNPKREDTKGLSSSTASDVSSSTQSRCSSSVSPRPKTPELRITVRDLDSEVKRLRDLLNLVLSGQGVVAVSCSCPAPFSITTEPIVGEVAGVPDWMPDFTAVSLATVSDFDPSNAWSSEPSSGLNLLTPFNPLNRSVLVQSHQGHPAQLIMMNGLNR